MEAGADGPVIGSAVEDVADEDVADEDDADEGEAAEHEAVREARLEVEGRR